MNALIFLLATLAVACVLGVLALDDPGYVIISRAPHEIEISLALFLLLLVAAFAAAYYALRAVFRALSARRDLARWNRQRNRERSSRDVLQGYARLIEGDWSEAERELTRRLEHSDAPLLNYLGAAYAAHQNADYGRRDRYLDAAWTSDRRFRNAVQLTRIRLQYQAGQLPEARATIESLPASLRKRGVVERMEAEILSGLGDWDTVEKRLPHFRRHKSFSSSEIDDLERRAFERLFAADGQAPDDPGALTAAWSALPKPQRRRPEMIAAYARGLVRARNAKQAGELLKAALNRDWNPELAELFGALDDGGDSARLRQCREWLEKHPRDPALLLTLGRLCARRGESDAARDYYARAIRHGASGQAYLELGSLLERGGELDEATRCYRRGLEARNRRLPAAPAPGDDESRGPDRTAASS